MTTFAPINDDHAVTSVLFGLQLDEFIEPNTLDAFRSASMWPEELPAVSNLPSVQINQGGQNYPVPALQYAIVRPDSRPIWSVKFSGYDLVVECTAYSRWAETWATASRYLSEAFKALRRQQPDLNIIDFRLQVTDQFVAQVEDFDASDLLNADCTYIPKFAFDGRKVWNAAAGWYDKSGDLTFADTFAIQVQGRGEDNSVKAPYLFTVQHFGKATTPGNPAPDIERLDEVTNILHDRNKVVIASALSNEAKQRIGLLP